MIIYFIIINDYDVTMGYLVTLIITARLIFLIINIINYRYILGIVENGNTN